MIPVIEAGDFVVVKFAKVNEKFENNDIIAFKYFDTILIKRLLASERDTLHFMNTHIRIKENKIPHDDTIINFVTNSTYPLIEPSYYVDLQKYISSIIPACEIECIRIQSGISIILPDELSFVVGDNYDSSLDSRIIGAIPNSQIIGKVIFTF